MPKKFFLIPHPALPPLPHADLLSCFARFWLKPKLPFWRSAISKQCHFEDPATAAMASYYNERFVLSNASEESAA